MTAPKTISPVARAASLSAALLLSVFACTDRIEIRTDAAPEHIVVYGSITDSLQTQQIRITRSAPYFTTALPVGVSGATVRVHSMHGIYGFTEDEPGVYLSDTPFAGVPETDYRLEVIVDFDESGIPEYYTASDRMPLPLAGEKAELGWSNRLDNHINILIWAELPEEQDNYICLKLSIGDRPITDSLSQFTFFDEEYLKTKKLEGVLIHLLDQRRDDYKVTAGDELGLTAWSLSKPYYDFLLYARREIQGSVPIFSGPPANVPTNIRQLAGKEVPVAGFFGAYSTAAVSVEVTEEFINTPHR